MRKLIATLAITGIAALAMACAHSIEFTTIEFDETGATVEGAVNGKYTYAQIDSAFEVKGLDHYMAYKQSATPTATVEATHTPTATVEATPTSTIPSEFSELVNISNPRAVLPNLGDKVMIQGTVGDLSLKSAWIRGGKSINCVFASDYEDSIISEGDNVTAFGRLADGGEHMIRENYGFQTKDETIAALGEEYWQEWQEDEESQEYWANHAAKNLLLLDCRLEAR